MTAKIFGGYDNHAIRIEEEFHVRIMNRASEDSVGDSILIDGED